MGLRRWFSERINGIRPGFGEEAIAVQVAVAASQRRFANWIFPLLITLLLIAFNAIYTLIPVAGGTPILIGRVILFDYLIFFFGWLSGWNAASKWRRDQEVLSELTTTPLSPAVAGNILFAGSLGIWWKCFLILFLTDLGLHLWTLGLNARFEHGLIIGVVSFPIWAITLLILAWFHLETMRLAHWMFAITALPGLNLIQRAVLMLLQVFGFVTALTALGSAITGAFFIVFALLGALLNEMVPASLLGFRLSYLMEVNPNPLWHLSSLAGLIAVALIKDSLARSYEKTFWGRYLMFIWWGAAERNHPAQYPAPYVQRAAQMVRAMSASDGITTRPTPEVGLPAKLGG